MGKIIETPVLLKDDSGEKESRGIAKIETWEQPERMRRALRFGGILFGLAVFSILIPGLHFILVPSFLIASPIVAWIMYGQSSVIAGGGGPCPKCGGDFKLARAKNIFPLNDLCEKCRSNVRVSLIQ